MDIIKALNSFHLDQHRIVDNDISNVLADDRRVVHDIDESLLLDGQTSLTELMSQRILIDFFKKTTA